MRSVKLVDVAENLSFPILGNHRRNEASQRRIIFGVVVMLVSLMLLAIFFISEPPYGRFTWNDALPFLAYILGLIGFPGGLWLLLSGFSEKWLRNFNQFAVKAQNWLALSLRVISTVASISLLVLLAVTSTDLFGVANDLSGDDMNLIVYVLGGFLALIALMCGIGSVGINGPVLSSGQLEPGSAVLNLRRVAAGTRATVLAGIGGLWFLWVVILQLTDEERISLATVITLSVGLIGWNVSRRRSMERARREILEQISVTSGILQKHPSESAGQTGVTLDRFYDVLVGDALPGVIGVAWNRSGNDTRLLTHYVRWRLSAESIGGLNSPETPVDLQGFSRSLEPLDMLAPGELVEQYMQLTTLWSQALRPPIVPASTQRKVHG